MRIAHVDTSRKVDFVAVDATDLKTREASLSSVVVYYSLDGGSATLMTTPTVDALEATYMTGDFVLSIDEAGMVALGAGVDSGELILHITAAEMAPVTRAIEIYRTPATRVVEGTKTGDDLLRLLLAVCACKSAGGGTSTITFRDLGDGKDRVTATVDANGNRTAITLDAS